MANRRAVAMSALSHIGVGGTIRQILPIVLAAALGWYMYQHIGAIDPSLIVDEISKIAAPQWLAALVATSVSFWAVGRYDEVLHRQFGTTVAKAEARRAGIAAIAISQTTGMGLLTGALVRWRMLPSLTLWQAIRLSMAVALSFLAGWLVVMALVLVLMPLPVPGLAAAAVVTLILAATLLAASVSRSARRRWPALPPPLRLIRILCLAAIDTGAAAVAFVVLVPETVAVPVDLLIPAFLLALGIGLASGTPGGVGPFEAVLLTIVPLASPEPLLATILAYRICYYFLPSVLAGVVLLLGPRPAPASAPVPAQSQPLLPVAPHEVAPLLAQSRAEAQLAHQGSFQLWAGPAGSGGWLVAQTALSLVMLGDPLPRNLPGSRRQWATCLTGPQRLARRLDRSAVFYKCSARMAVALRSQGYSVIRIGDEAHVCPASFRSDIPERANLRRKIRKAERAGILCSDLGPNHLPIDELAAVSANWVSTHGTERGFSMGRFDPGNLTGQRLFLARCNGRLVAFISFHVTAPGWSLDLMRHADDAPDGTMQALISTAIAVAARQGVADLSLAAVPSSRTGPLCRAIDRATGAVGLRQFKALVAPDWTPLYLAAPGPLSLAMSAIDIAWSITRPGPLADPVAFDGNGGLWDAAAQHPPGTAMAP